MSAQTVRPVLLVVQHGPSDPPGRLGEWLTAAGLDLDVRRPYAGDDLPQSLDAHRGLLVLGGAMGVGDDDEAAWLPRVRALLAFAVDDGVPTLGVGLGAQLLAAATGGVVGPNPDGPEFGAHLIAKRAAAATDLLFRDLPITPDVIQWHYDAILQLPPGAAHLASSPGCEVQAFRVGRLGWGIQFHIETTPGLVRRKAEQDSAALAEYDGDALLARSDAAHLDIAEVWPAFAASFAAVVSDPQSAPSVMPIAPQTAEPITDPALIRAALAAEMLAARPGAAVISGPRSGPVPLRLARPDER